MTCTTITKTVKAHHKTRKVHVKKCATKVVTAPVTFTTSFARATLTRSGVTYATGTLTRSGLILHTIRRTPRGRYALLLRWRDGRVLWTTRQRIMIG